ncbi:hypothetical protein FHR32_003562 [Streptosporangium album]|uniref:DUF4097 domain-containing protein n=1 Tax=Streptosporangium album TaxID=47479 RepID=A0A7W7RW79_9ACTN|nr:DUF4097 family beta strand repeat-containing protein [Streptosporangium album]MBB4939257.1 hypothetical protein [Streptosporangium album]
MISIVKTKSMIAAGALLASCVLLTGCGLQDLGKASERDEVSYDVGDQVAKLDVRGRTGNITVVEKDRTGIRVVETLHWRGDKPKTEHRVEGDALVVSYLCESDWGSCGVDYQVEVPMGLHVKVDNRSGDVTLRALSGVVEAATSSGAIVATELGGKKFLGETVSGDIELKYTAEPDDVEMETGSGNGTVYVPDGVYDVTTDAVTGDVAVKVADNSASKHRISITTVTGDAKVLPS